jgi:hypothetical protein
LENPQTTEISVELPTAVASALGKAWAHDVANALHTQGRSAIGAWPGTLREARSRVLMGLPAARQPTFDVEALQALSRALYDAARRSWDDLAEPDPEP